jgi:hypothetical protein
VSKVEFSQWRCTVRVLGSETGECDAVVVQRDLEDHLRMEHRIKARTPQQAIEHFVLTRSSDLGRGPGRRPAVKDDTMEMFTREDFR